MSNLTLGQEQCLNRLRYLSPLFVRMGKEVTRYLADDSLCRIATAFEVTPRGFVDSVREGFHELFPPRWTAQTFSGAINFDAVTGYVYCHLHGPNSQNVRFQIPDWPTPPEPPPLPDDLAALFAKTLRPSGIPGVLADWIDERIGEFGRFTQLLRHGRRLEPNDNASGVNFRQFRYRIVSENAVFWAANGTNSNDHRPPPQLPLIGIGLFADGGLQKKWEFVLDREQVADFGDVAAVWRDFPDPDIVESPDEYSPPGLFDDGPY